MSEEDRSHPSVSDQAVNTVVAYNSAFEGVRLRGGEQLSGLLYCGRFEESGSVLLIGKEGFDLAAQRVVPLTGFTDEGGSFRFITIKSSLHKLVNFLPPFGLHPSLACSSPA
ncbi:MAG: hypothetical protein AB1631_04795 [Acidobacteriota bacterium]